MSKKPTKERSVKDDILDDIEVYHQYHIFPTARVINLNSGINAENGQAFDVGHSMSNTFIKNLSILEALSIEPITILLNTDGGDIYQGMAIYDAIKASKCHITIKVKGTCMSIGSIILQAGKERILTPFSAVMFHAGNGDAGGGNPTEAKRNATFEETYCKRIDDVIFVKINEKRANDNQAPMSRNTFELMVLKGMYMSAEEAVEMGLADRIEK